MERFNLGTQAATDHGPQQEAGPEAVSFHELPQTEKISHLARRIDTLEQELTDPAHRATLEKITRYFHGTVGQLKNALLAASLLAIPQPLEENKPPQSPTVEVEEFNPGRPARSALGFDSFTYEQPDIADNTNTREENFRSALTSQEEDNADWENYRQTRYAIKIEHSETGEPIYVHEDKETTDIINYLSGRGELPESVTLACVKSVAADLFDPIRKQPAAIDALSTKSDITTYIAQSYENTKPEERFSVSWRYRTGQLSEEELLALSESAQEFAENEYASIENWNNTYRQQLSPELYEKLWEIALISGAPKVRFATTEQIVQTQRQKSNGSQYNANANTMFLDSRRCTYNLIGSYVAEQAHAKNRHIDPKGYFIRAVVDSDLEFAHEIHNTGRTYDQHQYQTPGTEEFIAHRQTEPALYARIASIVSAPTGVPLSRYEDNAEREAVNTIVVSAPQGEQLKKE